MPKELIRKVDMVLDQIRDKAVSLGDFLRAVLVFLIYGKRFARIGFGIKIRGASKIELGSGVSLGRFCWIDAVYKYGAINYCPRIIIGSDVACSDFLHVSCVDKIEIGVGTLIGSKVYIGDHNHGFSRNLNTRLSKSPRYESLQDIEPVLIGCNCWIGDGAVILGGTIIAGNSVVAANSVVKGKFSRPCIIAGSPAKVVRYIDGK